MSEYKVEGFLQTEKSLIIYSSAVSAPLSFDNFVFKNSDNSCAGLVARRDLSTSHVRLGTRPALF